LAGLLVAAVISGCQTAAPPSSGTSSGASLLGGASLTATVGSVAIGVFTSAPPIPRNDGSIWYYGHHPHPAKHPLGSFCRIDGSHRHDYAPYRGHRYVFHDGHYFWVGDAKPYAIGNPAYDYYGHHPHPHYFGGYCRIRGLHQHGYAPNSADYYRLHNGAYFFTGVYGSDYYANRARYDVTGWRREQRARGYREHERARRETQGVVDAEAVNPRRLTPGELVERMRARSAGASNGAPANRADDGARE